MYFYFMDRTIDAILLEWKDKTRRKPLLLRGARQTGKTYAVRKLGARFASFIEINFEREPRFAQLFAEDLNAEKILQDICALLQKQIVPGETLLFFDEIQVCPRAVVALRYFYETVPAVHVIAAGSLLEFEFQNLSIPVGRVDFLYVRPFTFTEFLNGTGNSILAGRIADASPANPLSEPLHNQATALVRDYLFIGGMPGVISAFTESKSYLSAEEEQRSILQTYRADFAKYSGKNGITMVENAFTTLPSMVGKKTVLSQIDPDARAYQINSALDLLSKTRVITKVRNTSGAGVPLSAGASEKFYKTIFLDVGLMQRQLGLRYEDWLRKSLVFDLHRGAVAEQFVGQELLHREGDYEDPGLFYWHRISRGSQAEVDYLCEVDSRVAPLEVKSSASGHLRSMRQFLEFYPLSPVGIKISLEPFKRENKIITIPLYATERSKELAREMI
jgi:uncharacterized protein